MKDRTLAWRPLLLLAAAMATTLVAAGCWDRVEVEDRGLVVGIAIDTQETGGLVMTFQYAVPGLIRPAGTSGADGGEGRGMQAFWNVATVSDSVFQGEELISTRAYPAPYLGHLQVLVFGEHAARQGIFPQLDFFLRSMEVRRSIPVMVARGSAATIMQLVPPLWSVPSIYLARLPENEVRTSRMGYLVTLGDLADLIRRGEDFILPRIIPGQQEVKLAGSAVFQRGRMVGWLGEEETQATRIIINRFRGGTVVSARDIIHPGEAKVNYRPTRIESEIKAVVSEGVPMFLVEVEADGDIVEHTRIHNVLEEDMLKLGRGIAALMEEQLLGTVKKVQRDLKADIFGFGPALRRQYPDTWRRLSPDWQQIFPQVEVRVKAKVTIWRVGVER